MRGLGLGFITALWLAICLSLLRLIQLWAYWPQADAGLWQELGRALWMGWRFDLKVCAVAALLLWPLLCWRRSARIALPLWAGLYILLGLVNFYYYGFYKTPIDSIVFGVIDDDTRAVFATLWRDFPLLQIGVFLSLAEAVALAGVWCLQQGWQMLWEHTLLPRAAWLWALPVLLLGMLIAAKGTLRDMALQPSHLVATSQPFLNDAVPNGVTALHNAWFAYHESLNIGTEDTGVREMGFGHVEEAAAALGLPAQDHEALARQLRAQGVNQPNGKHLVFFQMESWSAEPMRYQGPGMDVLGRLKPQLDAAIHFDNVDSAQGGTHPALEAFLFGTPLTPISTGRYRDVVYDWGLAQVFKRAGYDTLFVTSGQSGWRELDRVLLRQGFDEFVDAASLRVHYPQAQGGIWGVWDAYMMDYIQSRLRAQPADRPLFIYAMTTTHHPPYEVPDEARRVAFDMARWQGDHASESLEASLRSYRYANEVLADFVANVRQSPQADRVLVAATGDHNMRTVGSYAQPARQVLRHQVPFVVWGATPLACPENLHAPASHLDIFPTLFPQLGIHSDYLQTGRDLWNCAATSSPLAVSFLQQVRSPSAMWQMGHAKTLACQPAGASCAWSEDLDRQARARVALLDWNVRRKVLQATAKVTP